MYGYTYLKCVMPSVWTVPIRDETLLWIYLRFIGRPYIAIARQVKIYRDISDPLGRLKYIAIYRTHSVKELRS